MSSAEQAYIDAAFQETLNYYQNFISQVGSQLAGSLTKAEVSEIVGKYESRIKMYSGGAWAVWNEAKVWDKNPEDLYRWEGPADEHSCSDCLQEVMAGIRPLKNINRRPGMCTCLSNCRCELIPIEQS